MAKGAYIGVNLKTHSNSIGDLDVGSIVQINENGSPVDYIVVHQGNPDSSFYDASCDGTWVLRKDIYASMRWNSSNGDYSNSDIHEYLNDTFLGLLDSNIQSQIKQIKIPYLAVETENTVNSGFNGLSTKIFLLGCKEIGMTGSSGIDGICLSYFANGGSKIAYNSNGTATYWWTRTINDSSSAFVIWPAGGGSNTPVTEQNAVRPAFILPSNLIIEDGIVTGEQAKTEGTIKSVARKIKKIYIGVNSTEFKSNFADNSWSQIIKACQMKQVPDTWEIGDQKAMTINGTDYMIDIIGKNHDDYADGSGKAPLTFQLHDCYDTTYIMDSSDTVVSQGWLSCAMRNNHLPAILALMPNEVQSAIKEVNKLVASSSGLSTITTTADKLFLLSEIEVFGSVSYSIKGEGSQYTYYAVGNSKKKYQNGVMCAWWERSPVSAGGQFFCNVDDSGNMGSSTNYTQLGVSFAFCFGGTSQIDNNLNANLIGDLEVGSIVQINENGSPVDYIIVHQGNPDSSIYDASCDGTWVLRKDVCFSTVQWDLYNNNDYRKSNVHSYLNTAFLSSLDTSVQNIIMQAKIPYVNGYGSTGFVDYGANGLSTKIFLLSSYEVGFTRDVGHSTNIPIEGTTLSYFNAIDTDSNRIAYVTYENSNRIAVDWPLRSPQLNGLIGLWVVTEYGGVGGNGTSDNYNIRPAFILPSNLTLTNNVVTGAEVSSGIKSVAHRIKKAYIGIGGVARPCWNNGELGYYGMITSLNEARYNIASASIGDKALFVGGHRDSSLIESAATTYSDKVDVYNTQLVHSVTTVPIIYAHGGQGAASNNKYAVFAGGWGHYTYGDDTIGWQEEVFAYDKNLTFVVAEQFLNESRTPASASIGDYALFVGGESSTSYSNDAEAYDSNLTYSSAPWYSQNAKNLAAASNNKYAIFAGGTTNEEVGTWNNVDAYNDNLTKFSASIGLSENKFSLKAASNGKYVVFAGGSKRTDIYTYPITDTVDAYDEELTKTILEPLSSVSFAMAPLSFKDYAVFVGGVTSNVAGIGEFLDNVDVYNKNLTKLLFAPASIKRYKAGSTVVGDYGIIAGGIGKKIGEPSYCSNEVEAFCIC